MINTIYKPKGSRIWRWKYRQQPGDAKIEDVSLRTSDKQVAEKRRGELLRERQHERDGLILPKPIREAAQRNLEEHLQDFLGDKRRQGGCDKYLANVEFRVKNLITGCEWNTLKNVSADSFQRWRREHKDFAAKTVNDYLDAAGGFFNWLVKNGRIQSNPLASVEKVKCVEGETRQRRAFSDEEMQRLLAVAGENNPVYLMAVHTGLRRSELKALKWGDVHLDAVTPFVQVRASTTKNGKPAAMRLHPELVKALEGIEGNKEPDAPVFHRIPRMKRFRGDLEAAGIEYCDESGRFADFHSLRKTLGTNLAKAGVASRVAMALMRHSDRKLTDKIYTDENLIGTWSAIDALPNYTEGASQGASQNLVAVSQNGSLGVTMDSGVEREKNIVKIGESRGVALDDTSGHSQTKWCAVQGSNL
jgi:integrase